MAARSTRSAKAMAERIELTATLLGAGMRKGEVKRALRARFTTRAGAPISARACEELISRARRLLVKGTGKTIEELRQESAWFYRTMLWDPDASLALKMRARENLDELLGLYPPQERKTTLRGDPAAPVTVVSVLEAKRRALAGR